MDISLEKQEVLSLSTEQLISRALESEKAIAANLVVSLEELEKEMQNW